MPNPVGRPSKYDPAYCERVIELGRLGKSPAQIAADIGVAKQTLANWGEAHPEFLAALTRAKTLEQAWWEDAAQNGQAQSVIGASVWAKSAAARFREDYTERQEQKLTGEVVAVIERRFVRPNATD